MTIEFKREQIEKREMNIHMPYVGYFSPSGDLIDYNVMFGENYHDTWRNPVSLSFLSFVSYIIKGTDIEHYKQDDPETYERLMYPGLKEKVIHGLGIFYYYNERSLDDDIDFLNSYLEELKNKYYLDEYRLFEIDLLDFFKKTYSNKKFFDALDKKIYVENENEMCKEFTKKYSYELSYDRKKELYVDYLKTELMKYFKDIAVQYLGYDSLERFKPNGEIIKIPYHWEKWDFDYFKKTKRIITTSYQNYYERFFNYMIMEWAVHKIPRYLWNEKENKFEKESYIRDFTYKDSEELYKKEIESIKRLVPIDERYKYFI